MKLLVALFLLISSIAHSESWSDSVVDKSNPSPVDEIMLQNPEANKINLKKLSHPLVRTIKIYHSQDFKKVWYVIYRWKPMPSHWEIIDLSQTNVDTKMAKGVPAEFVTPELLVAQGDVGNYSNVYNKRLTKIRRTKTQKLSAGTKSKGVAKFEVSYGMSGFDTSPIESFYMSHNVKAVSTLKVNDSSRHIVLLFYEEDASGRDVNVNYEVENE